MLGNSFPISWTVSTWKCNPLLANRIEQKSGKSLGKFSFPARREYMRKIRFLWMVASDMWCTNQELPPCYREVTRRKGHMLKMAEQRQLVIQSRWTHQLWNPSYLDFLVKERLMFLLPPCWWDVVSSSWNTLPDRVTNMLKATVSQWRGDGMDIFLIHLFART